MAEPGKNPELDKEDQAILESFDRSREEQVTALGKVLGDRYSRSSIGGEIGTGDLKELEAKQKEELRKLSTKYKEQFEKQSKEMRAALGLKVSSQAETTTAFKAERDALAEQLLKEAKEAAERRVSTIENLVNANVAGDQMTVEEAAKIKKLLDNVDKILTSDPQTQKIIEKLQNKNRQELSPADYLYVLKMLADTREGNFDGSVGGILVGLMNAKERYQMVEELMKSSDKDKTPKTIEDMLKLGTLNITQGQQLFTKAIKAQILTQEDYDKNYRTKFDEGTYLLEAQKNQEAIKSEVDRMKGAYATNPFNRAAGMLPGLLGMVHGALWATTNLLASGGNLGELAKSPYFIASLVEMGVSVESFSGNMRGGGIGEGWVSDLIHYVVDKEGPQTTEKLEAYKTLGNIYKDYPEVSQYLENGGVEKIIEVRDAKRKEGTKDEEMEIGFKDLLDIEKDSGQRTKLEYAEKNFPQSTLLQFHQMIGIIKVLEIQKQDDFKKKLDSVKESIGIQPN